MLQLSFSHGTDTGSEDYGLTYKAARTGVVSLLWRLSIYYLDKALENFCSQIIIWDVNQHLCF